MEEERRILAESRRSESKLKRMEKEEDLRARARKVWERKRVGPLGDPLGAIASYCR